MKELSLFNVHSLQRLAPFAGLALKTVPDACIPSSFSVAIGLDRFGKEPVRNVPVASGGNLLTYLGKPGIDLLHHRDKAQQCGSLLHSRNKEFVVSAMFDVRWPYRGSGKNARTQCSFSIPLR